MYIYSSLDNQPKEQNANTDILLSMYVPKIFLKGLLLILFELNLWQWEWETGVFISFQLGSTGHLMVILCSKVNFEVMENVHLLILRRRLYEFGILILVLCMQKGNKHVLTVVFC